MDILLSNDQKRLLAKYGMDRQRVEYLRQTMRRGRWVVLGSLSRGP